jgi:hypothetical protein
MMPHGEQVTYQVTGVAPDTQFTAGNTVIQGKRVQFSASSGYSGWIFVPDSVFADQGAVSRMIEAEVQLVAAAQNITGTIS